MLLAAAQDVAVQACGRAHLSGQARGEPARRVCGLQRRASQLVHRLPLRPCHRLHPGHQAGDDVHSCCLQLKLQAPFREWCDRLSRQVCRALPTGQFTDGLSQQEGDDCTEGPQQGLERNLMKRQGPTGSCKCVFLRQNPFLTFARDPSASGTYEEVERERFRKSTKRGNFSPCEVFH